MIEIRPEDPACDAAPIEALYDEAFGPGHFAKTAERLREWNASLEQITRVAERDGEVLGVCRVWPIEIGGAPALFYGPVAVGAAFRGERLGLTVTGEALEAGTAAGWPVALLIGAPAYFGELGFQVVEPGRVTLPGPQDMRRVMLRDLAGQAAGHSGSVSAPRGARRAGAGAR